MQLTVCDVETIAASTDRIVCSDGATLEVCKIGFELRAGDVIDVECSASPLAADYIAHGTAFAQNTHFSFVSCGGLLCKLPMRLPASTPLLVHVTRAQKKRGRGAA
jgi:hypothetical protein